MNVAQRLAQDSINWQIRAHTAEAEVAELRVKLAQLENAKPVTRRRWFRRK